MTVILSIAIVMNVFFLACVTAWLSKIYDQIGSIHQAESKAYTRGWDDCTRALRDLRNVQREANE